jgi:hypothetical protein
MPSFLEMLRMSNIFNPQNMIGNDLPSQGGISGRMALPEPNFSDMFNRRGPVNPMGDISQGQAPTSPYILNAAQPTPPTPPMSPSPGAPESISPSDRIAQAMREAYQPRTESTERFDELLKQYPNRDEYKPSLLRRIGAALSAFGPGGQQAGMEFLNRPLTEKMTDWQSQIGPAQSAANLERQENINNRTLAYQTVSAQLRAESDAHKAQMDETKAQIAQQRANIYEFKARNPNLKFDFSSPNVMVANPITGEIKDTGIPTGSLSDADKMALGQEQALERIETTGEQARETATLREDIKPGNWSVVNIPDPNDPTKQIAIRVNADTGAVEPVTMGGKQIGPVMSKSGTSGQPDPKSLQAVQNMSRDALNELNNILDEKGNLRPDISGTVGKSRIFQMHRIYGSDARQADAKIKRLKDLITLSLIGEMKSQSKTGATGFGQMNIRELGVLEGAATKLDPSLDEETFTQELRRIKERLEKILQPADSFSEITTPSGKPTAAELIRKYGGG